MNNIIKDKIMLGHNPLFGIDHLSAEQGDIKALQFEDEKRILDVLLYCNELGVKGMMMSTHPRAKVVADLIMKTPELKDWRIYPLLPYVYKYVVQANEKGLLNVLLDVLSQSTLAQKFSFMFQGAKGVLGKDIDQLITLLLDIEMLFFKGLNYGAIFLHDAITDLALGLGVDSVFDTFRNHVEKNYGAPAAFISKNVPILCKRLKERGWENITVMTAFNKIGFDTNPSLDAIIDTINQPGVTFIPMTTLASGALKPREAYEYIAQFPQIKSMVVGMSKKEHIKETVSIINELFN